MLQKQIEILVDASTPTLWSQVVLEDLEYIYHQIKENTPGAVDAANLEYTRSTSKAPMWAELKTPGIELF